MNLPHLKRIPGQMDIWDCIAEVEQEKKATKLPTGQLDPQKETSNADESKS